MSILSLADFASSTYRDVNWRDIFCSAGSAVSSNAEPIGLINRENIIMVPDNFLDYKNIKICFPDNYSALVGEDILYSSFPCSLVSGITFLRVDTDIKINKSENVDKCYISFLCEIASGMYSACNAIFKYTHEHLSRRYIDDTAISKNSIIQSDFSVVYVMLEKLAIAVKNFFTIYDAIYCTSLAIEILLILSRLSGARSVLRNRSIELMYHFKIFERFMLV